jgi:hypothetical protein
MRHRGQDLLLDPLPVDQRPVLVAGPAEAAGLAGEGQQILVPAGVAVDPGEALVEVAAIEKAVQGLVLDAAMNVPGLAQLIRVLADAAVQGAGPRVAGAIDLLLGCGVRAFHSLLARAEESLKQKGNFSDKRVRAHFSLILESNVL